MKMFLSILSILMSVAFSGSELESNPGGTDYFVVMPESRRGSNGFDWDEAKQACIDAGSKLATISREVDGKMAINAKLDNDKLTGTGLWVGLRNQEKTENGVTTKKWVNYDGAPCTDYEQTPEKGITCDELMFWAPGEPSNSQGIEDCAFIYPGTGRVPGREYSGIRNKGTYGVRGMLNDAKCDLKQFGGALGALCMGTGPKGAHSEPMQDLYYPEEFVAPSTSSSEVVFRFTMNELLVMALVIANVITVAISSYLYCASKRTVGVQYSAVDAKYTTDEELA